MAQTEDVASGFVLIITTVLNLLPSIENTPGLLTSDQSLALISIAGLLKALLGYTPFATIGTTSPPIQTGSTAAASTQAPPAAPLGLTPGVYAIAGRNSTGGSFTGSYTITTTQSDADAALAKLGLTNIVWGAKIG